MPFISFALSLDSIDCSTFPVHSYILTPRTGLTKQEKTTDIWFDEKVPLIHIRTHNTDLKKRLAAYSGQYPDQCRQTDADPETGCMEFEIRKGRFSFRLTAPYSEERRNAASKAAKKHSGNLTHPIQKDVL